MRTRVIAAFFALAAVPALAADPALDTRKIAPDQFPDVVQVLRVELEPGGRFDSTGADERTAVLARLDQMSKLLVGRQSMDELREDQKVALINAQEWINGVLAKHDRDRLVCERRAPIGSHRKETLCETYGEKLVRTEAAQKDQRERRKDHPCKTEGPSCMPITGSLGPSR